MKTEEQIKVELERIKSDDRLTYEPAIVTVNAPLALIQMALEAQVHALEWVLGLPKSRFPYKSKKADK